MKIAISGLNEQDRKQILTHLNTMQKTNAYFQTKEYRCGAQLLADMRKGIRFDAIILDVDVDNVARSIRELDSEVLLIFQAHSYNQISDAFEVYPSHYLLKPLDVSVFVNEFKRVFQRHYHKRKVFSIEWKHQMKQISLKNIVSVECFNRHILVRTATDEMESYQTFQETAQKLIPLGFIRVHHSFLVNLAHIVEISQNEIIGPNGIMIPISIRRKKEVLEEYRTYMQRYSV